jgi:hypothetical protein
MGCNAVMVCAGSVDWDDLINGGANVPYQGNGYLALHIAVEYELIPVVKAILPTGHLSIAAPVLIDAGPILNTALIAQRERTVASPVVPKRLSCRKKASAYTGSMPYFTPRV